MNLKYNRWLNVKQSDNNLKNHTVRPTREQYLRICCCNIRLCLLWEFRKVRAGIPPSWLEATFPDREEGSALVYPRPFSPHSDPFPVPVAGAVPWPASLPGSVSLSSSETLG